MRNGRWSGAVRILEGGRFGIIRMFRGGSRGPERNGERSGAVRILFGGSVGTVRDGRRGLVRNGGWDGAVRILCEGSFRTFRNSGDSSDRMDRSRGPMRNNGWGGIIGIFRGSVGTRRTSWDASTIPIRNGGWGSAVRILWKRSVGMCTRRTGRDVIKGNGRRGGGVRPRMFGERRSRSEPCERYCDKHEKSDERGHSRTSDADNKRGR